MNELNTLVVFVGIAIIIVLAIIAIFLSRRINNVPKEPEQKDAEIKILEEK